MESKKDSSLSLMKTLLMAFAFIAMGSPHVAYAADPVAPATTAATKEEVQKVQRSVDDIKSQIDQLEAARKPKMLSPYKDVDFLFEVTFGPKGGLFDASVDGGVLEVDGKRIRKLKIVRHLFSPDEAELTFDGQQESVKLGDLVPMTMEAKMQAVEKALGLDRTDKDLKQRINQSHVELNNPDWQNDDLRFGVMESFLPDGKITATSIALHGYFGYRRFSPGATPSVSNFLRRFSYFFAVGTGSASDQSADIKTPILSTGLGIDIIKGFAVSVGASVFSYRPSQDQGYQSRLSLTAGVTLNSDLWRAFFSSK